MGRVIYCVPVSMVFLRGLPPIREDLPAGPVREAQYAFDAGVSRLGATANEQAPEAEEALVLDAAVGLPRPLAADASDDGLHRDPVGVGGHTRTVMRVCLGILNA